jgi:hypothetical protein
MALNSLAISSFDGMVTLLACQPDPLLCRHNTAFSCKRRINEAREARMEPPLVSCNALLCGLLKPEYMLAVELDGRSLLEECVAVGPPSRLASDMALHPTGPIRIG